MASTKFLAISCLVFLLQVALGFQSPEAALSGCPQKTKWPEVVGLPGCQAAAHIKKENSGLNPIVIPHNTPVPYNYICTRVYIPINGHMGLVSDTPRAG